MAKGNLFLGTAARSVGDVVMYRREGAQVSRVRVRKIANPKTDAQCLQRAFMSACVKFYQPLANVLDRSWQGKSRAKSYAAFLKANAPKVRAAGYYIPKGTGFYPLPLQLSEGTITPLNGTIDNGNLQIVLSAVGDGSVAPSTVGDLSAFFVNSGYKNGDILSFIYVKGNSSDGFVPASIQFELDTTSTVTMETAFGSKISVQLQEGDHLLLLQFEGTNNIAAAGIVARNVDGVWQRSKESLSVAATTLTPITSDAAKTACIDSYKGAAASDNPLVYLDGDELTD